MSKNLKRAPYGAATKARVREMREAGYSVVQITESTGVPGSTIARWAAEGGWRVSDLVEEPEFVDPISEPEGRLKDACASVSVGHSIHWIECDTSRPCVAPRTNGCRMNPPVELSQVPEGLLPGLGGESWENKDRSFLRRQESGCSAVDRDPRLRGDERDSGFSSRDPDGSHRTGSRLRSLLSDQSGSPERAPCDASASREQTNTKPEQSRQERLEDALEKAAFAAEDAITRGNFTAAGKAVQMADTLSKALERVRASAEEEKPDGVFMSYADLDAARADLMRRINRIAKTIRPEEME